MLSLSLTILALASATTAQVRGFNYGALYADNRARRQADWEADFRAAQSLPGVGGFTSARLFTMIQGYTDNSIIEALPAAAATNTSLLLGLWASAGPDAFNNELTALRNAIAQYGDSLKDQIVGISIGSEDLYRISPTGIENESGPGAQPEQLVNYIRQARDVLRGTAWSDKQIGHVDTWTAYVNGSNSAVVSALDWVGVDAYPYFETVNDNTIDNAGSLFFDAYYATVGAAQGKPVWVTESGWPVTGPQSGAATSGTSNAEKYWKQVACRILGSVNTWWYQLNDGADQEVSFKVIGADRGAPLYDLSCPAGSSGIPSRSDSGTVTTQGSNGSVVAPTGTPGPRPMNPGNSTTPSGSGGSPNDNNQNAGAGSSPSGSASTGNSPSGTGSNTPAFTGAASKAGHAAAGVLLVAGAMAAVL